MAPSIFSASCKDSEGILILSGFFSFDFEICGFIIVHKSLLLKIDSKGLWSVLTIKYWQPTTDILALFKHDAAASPSVGEYCFSVGVLNLDPVCVNCHPNNLSSSAVQRNLLFGLMSSLNGCMIPLTERAQATWFTKPNKDWAPVISCGTQKYESTERMLLEGVIPDSVSLRPVKVTVFLQD